jgi:outer membrane protein assembly factor BamD
MQVAMAHYRMMEKSDRDNSQAEDAESEFQIFLKKYPDSPLRPKAEQYLRNVQEVIADGEFRVARFYFTRARANPADYPAAAARLMEVSQRYPLYSQTDEALWMLAAVYERAKKFSKNEDDKNHWSDLASQCYSRIVTEYPLSKLAPDAKARLQGMGVTVPPADAAALARMEKDRTYEKEHRRAAALAPLTAFEASPSVAFAARDGDPNFNPPDDAVSATAVLKQGAAGPSFGIAAQQPAADSSDSASAPNIIEGSAVPTDSAGPPTTGVGAEIIEAPSSPAEAASSSSSSMSSSSSSSSTPETTTAVISNVDNSTSSASAPATVPPAGASSITDQAPGTPSLASPQGPTPATLPVPASGSGSSSSQAGPGKAAPAAAPSADSSKESTSKKKKGLHKLVPF